MPLTSGTRLGVYEVTALIGQGGMGEVYKATDTRLDRLIGPSRWSGVLSAQVDHQRVRE